MGMFKNPSTVKLIGDYNYVKVGHYINRIDKIHKIDSRKHELFIAIDMTVLTVLPSSEPPPFHKVGDEICHMIKITGNEYAEADWTRLLMVVLESIDPNLKQIDLDGVFRKEVCGGADSDDWACSESQPLAGWCVEMDNNIQITKKGMKRIAKKYMRVVPKEEVLRGLNPDEVKRFFPAGPAA